MSPDKKRRILPIVLACTTALFALLFFQASSDLSTQKAQLAAAQAEIKQMQQAAISPEEVQSYEDELAALEAANAELQSQVDSLTTQNAEQAAELTNRQSQIDSLWARVDAAQQNLDAAYAKIDANQQAVSSRSSASSGSASAASAGESNSQTVYITKTGSKYHNSGCQYLRQSKIAISLSDAKAQGYSACSRCF